MLNLNIKTNFLQKNYNNQPKIERKPFRQLTKDCVCFSSKKDIEKTKPDPYKTINQIATEYVNLLKTNFEEGIKFLKKQIPNLKINCININNGSAGCASIIPGNEPETYLYNIDLACNSKTILDSTTHEGYHILQFEYDKDQPYIKTRKMLAKLNDPDSKIQEEYDLLQNIVIQHIFLNPYKNAIKETEALIEDAMKKNLCSKIEQINQEKLENLNKQLLPEELKNWFKTLPEKEHIEYIKSHAEIEIKAHSFCKNTNNDNIIYDRNTINRNKLRDIIAIKLYTEIAQMAENELANR
ncbi:MAG: hypothetical protein AB7V50_08400 [Vampirovibrionia bacterium]